jgi:hypothetical protein
MYGMGGWGCLGRAGERGLWAWEGRSRGRVADKQTTTTTAGEEQTDRVVGQGQKQGGIIMGKKQKQKQKHGGEGLR